MMNGGWDYGTSPWYGMIFGPIMMIVFIVLTVLIIAWVLRARVAVEDTRRYPARHTQPSLRTR